MNARNVIRAVLVAACGLFALSALAEKPPEVSHDGLHLVKSKNVRMLYTRPGATLTPYKRVAIIDCEVAFHEDWQKEQRSQGHRIDSDDMQRIRGNLAAEFREVFVDELTKGGYQVVDKPGADVLILRPALVDLVITAPDVMTPGRGKTFTTSAGGMTLFLEMFDGASGEILARAIDRKEARDTGRMEWTTSVSNKREADRILRKWAVLMREALDRSRGMADPAQ